MAQSQGEPDQLDALLARATPEVQAILLAARAALRELLPTATEKVHLGWQALEFMQGSRYVDVAMMLHLSRTYVNLEFRDGIDLPDPAHRLEGTGKRLRHVKLRTPESVQDPAVRALVHAQAALRPVR